MRIACGATHSMAVTENLELLAWGGNNHGQVGDGSKQLDPQRCQKFPVTIFKNNICACAAGKAHSLAVTSAGEVYAWGNNEDCLLGTGWESKQVVPKRIRLEDPHDPLKHCHVKAVSAGVKHSLALTDAGEVFAWGANEYGQLGDGTRAARRSPVKIIGGNVTAIASGWYHNLAITDTGDVWTWGFTSQDPSSGAQKILAPTLVINGGIQAVAAGATHSLALTESGEVLAWGGNDYGQLGDGTMSRRITPVTVALNCTQITAGSYHSIALDANTNVLQWGFMVDPAHGVWKSQTTPSSVYLEGGAFAIAAGGVHTMAISNKGSLWVWGGNSCGQIGDNLVEDRIDPVCTLPDGTMETIPLSVLVARAMKGPAEMAENKKQEERDAHKEKYAGKIIEPIRHSEYGVPELLQKSVGHRPKLGGSLGATYPLSFNNSMRPIYKASRSTGSLGFVPGTGFRPGTMGNTMETISWPEGPGTHNPNRRRRDFSHLQGGSQALALMGPKTDPGALALGSGTSRSRQRALPAAAATDGFGSWRHKALADSSP